MLLKWLKFRVKAPLLKTKSLKIQLTAESSQTKADN
jgi:hypothetical protein